MLPLIFLNHNKPQSYMGSHVEKGDPSTIAEHTCMGETGGVDGLSNQTREPTSKNVWLPFFASPVLAGLPALLVCYFCQTFLPSRHVFSNCSLFASSVPHLRKKRIFGFFWWFFNGRTGWCWRVQVVSLKLCVSQSEIVGFPIH